MSIIKVIKGIQGFSDVYVDCGFLQGEELILKQLRQRNEGLDLHFAIQFIEDTRRTIQGLVQKSAPYIIPDDYIFFLEFYGGIFIEGNDYNFSTLGVGPMVEDWYGSVDSDEAFQEPGRYGFLSVGSLNFGVGHQYEFQRVKFFLDLAGNVQKYSVIGIGPWSSNSISPNQIVKSIYDYPDTWMRIADSFTEWLDLAVETRGRFHY